MRAACAAGLAAAKCPAGCFQVERSNQGPAGVVSNEGPAGGFRVCRSLTHASDARVKESFGVRCRAPSSHPHPGLRRARLASGISTAEALASAAQGEQEALLAAEAAGEAARERAAYEAALAQAAADAEAARYHRCAGRGAKGPRQRPRGASVQVRASPAATGLLPAQAPRR
jgi:hypothetical protein